MASAYLFAMLAVTPSKSREVALIANSEFEAGRVAGHRARRLIDGGNAAFSGATERKSLMDDWICQEAKQSKGVNYFKNLQQPDCKNLCFPEHRVWLRRHKSNHGWNRTRSESRTHRDGHLVEFASTRLRL